MTSDFEWKILKFHTDKPARKMQFNLQVTALRASEIKTLQQKLFFTIDSWDENPI